MLTGFVFENRRLQQSPLDKDAPLPNAWVWVDLVSPTAEERLLVESSYDQQLPSTEELEEIEDTARFYTDERGLHIHSYFIDDADLAFQEDAEQPPKKVTASFTVNNGRLFTVHEVDLADFRMFRLRARRRRGIGEDGLAVMLGLFETKVDLLADLLEELYNKLEEASCKVFSEDEQDMDNLLGLITRFEDLNGKIRLVLLDTQRAVRFLLRHAHLDEQGHQTALELLRDIDSLMPHTGYLFEKVNFLMDAATGMINVEQNRIIKVMTLASVVFLPPTLIASIYGMNFRLMPELGWPAGYPLALGAMVLSAIAPYWLFKHKGWL